LRRSLAEAELDLQRRGDNANEASVADNLNVAAPNRVLGGVPREPHDLPKFLDRASRPVEDSFEMIFHLRATRLRVEIMPSRTALLFRFARRSTVW
jgi:hypothetical protein